MVELKKKIPDYLFSWAIENISYGLKEFELSMVNEQSVFELLRFDCMLPASVAQFDWRPGGRGFNPAEVGNILSLRLIMKYILRSFPFADSRRAVVSFWRKKVHNTG